MVDFLNLFNAVIQQGGVSWHSHRRGAGVDQAWLAFKVERTGAVGVFEFEFNPPPPGEFVPVPVIKPGSITLRMGAQAQGLPVPDGRIADALRQAVEGSWVGLPSGAGVAPVRYCRSCGVWLDLQDRPRCRNCGCEYKNAPGVVSARAGVSGGRGVA